MATKREVERNEKIIRGLMKLPPNRRCINCNGLGPQYVCTNFWTFVCMICSGIHREFTHRVKSVSMSTFTSQEVEALQNGGNQRAREIYLKNWDLDRHRQPNSSNADKVREFIKAVYIDCQYAGGNSSEQPLQVMQIQRNVGDETRRASSYHSFSQSPPYDFQYEDRLNRKHTGSLTRKPGSDHKLYGKKATSFIYSPGRLSERHYEDKFANEGFSSRLSDYSFSSGDLLNSEPQSPNLYKDDGFTSPMSDSSREIIDGLHHQTPGTCSETFVKRDIEKAPVPLPQRTVSSGSIGSFEKNSAPLRSVDSGSLFDVYSEGNHSNVTLQNQTITVPSPSPSPAENYGGLNLFEDALAMPGPNSSFDVDLFQAQKTGSAASMDLFHKPADSSALSQTSPLTSLSYSISQNPSTSNPNQMLPEQSEPSNEAWATFDFPHPSPPGTKTLESCVTEPGGISLENFHPAAPSIAWSLWPEFKKSSFQSPPGLVSNQWNEGLQNVDVPANMSSSQIWKPFEDANALQHHCIDTRSVNLQVNASSNAELFSGFQTSEDSGVDGKNASTEGFSFPTLPSHVSSVKSSVEPMHPFMSDVVRQNSGNPFDVPFDSEFEAHNTLLDMSTLPIALPNMPLPSSSVGDVNDQWYHGNPGASGGMSYISKQTLSSQLENVPTHGPIASVGGNPFA